jgi:beta-glucosidase
MDMKKSAIPSDTVVITVKLKNTGDFNGDEVIQVYAKHPENGKQQPLKSLIAFQRVFLKKGEERILSVPLVLNELRQWDYSREDYTVVPGIYDIQVGASSADIWLQSSLQIVTK